MTDNQRQTDTSYTQKHVYSERKRNGIGYLQKIKHDRPLNEPLPAIRVWLDRH
jgi:hypothetical protein